MDAVATPEYYRCISKFASRSELDLLALLPSDLSEAERAKLVEEFYDGMNHLVFIMLVKLCHVEEVPWCIFHLTSARKAVVDAALTRLLVSDHTHPKVRMLQSPPLREQAELWLAAANVRRILAPDLRELLMFVAQFRFAHLGERPVNAYLHKVLQVSL